MNQSILIAATGAVLTLIICLLTYALMAGLACFAGWTTDYWYLSNWDGFSRTVLFVLCAFWVARGIWATVVTIREAEK
ncbi:hypothetical protein [Marinobacter nauticus]|uniref:Uncharacterized protein n=1 Tax=Marinobacter nauticus TaxID=2743 RepID=A0A1M2V0W6_MARNT|nr:hypothetical protein [Marinobacter nauticus]OJT01216.1 hypothetical protein BEE62_14795 [Marinobacter nauticus]